MNTRQFVRRLTARAEAAGGQGALARELNVSPATISAVINGRIDPTPALVEAMGFAREYRYVKVEGDAPVGVR